MGGNSQIDNRLEQLVTYIDKNMLELTTISEQ
jgi:hypothetical protein